MSVNDLMEVGRFRCYMAGEHGAYSFTPHFWLDRWAQRGRWLFWGLWQWVRYGSR